METTKTDSATGKIVTQKEGTFLNVMGDHQTVKLSGKDTNGQFTLVEQNNPPGTGIPPHLHEREDEIFQVVQGEVEFMMNGKAETLKAGDLVYLPKGTPHGFRVTGSQPAKVMLSIFPAGIEGMFEKLSQLPEGPPDMKKITAICGEYGVRFI